MMRKLIGALATFVLGALLMIAFGRYLAMWPEDTMLMALGVGSAGAVIAYVVTSGAGNSN